MGNFAAYFDAAIASIFARELIEASVIIVNYRTLIRSAEHWNNAAEKNRALKAVTVSAILASLVAVVMVSIFAVVSGIVSSHLTERVLSIISGVSELVAAVAVLQLSIKIPVWLGLYENVSILPCREHPSSFANHSLEEPAIAEVATITLQEIRFNVMLNLWREVAECGLFLIPFFIGGKVQAIPISALVGIVVALIVGGLLHLALNRTASKFYLALIMAMITGMFSVGLFVGAAHEFELLAGETQTIFVIQNPLFSGDSFPMLFFEPFGYTTSETVLQLVCFWCWLVLGCLLHFLKYRATKRSRERRNQEQNAPKIHRSDRMSGTEVTLSSGNILADCIDLEESRSHCSN
jgi:high-affinity iron transporter